jgi:hypothetical protein
VTVWANAGHVFIEFHGIGRYQRADTNYLYAGEVRGPHVRTHAAEAAYTGAYTPRHWPGE